MVYVFVVRFFFFYLFEIDIRENLYTLTVARWEIFNNIFPSLNLFIIIFLIDLYLKRNERSFEDSICDLFAQLNVYRCL